jgi:hypothetical protein
LISYETNALRDRRMKKHGFLQKEEAGNIDESDFVFMNAI